MRPQLLHYLVDSFAEVLGLEVSSGGRALILLPSIILSVDAFIVSEVDVLLLGLGSSCLLEFVLIVWQLVKIVLVLMAPLVLHSFYLFGMNSSLIYHFVLEICLNINML